MADRYFAEAPILTDAATLTGAEAHHLIHVMRAKPGTEVVLFDGQGDEFAARVERLTRTEVHLAVLSRIAANRESPLSVTLAVALPKGDRQRWLVEKAVELGVRRLIPLETQRSVSQGVDKALSRLGRFVVEACKQCGRNRLMEIAPSAPWAQIAESAALADTSRWMAHPASEHGPEALRLAIEKRPAQIWLVVGPEGGFTEAEMALGLAHGWRPLCLGPAILRVETAALAVAALALGLSFEAPPSPS